VAAKPLLIFDALESGIYDRMPRSKLTEMNISFDVDGVVMSTLNASDEDITAYLGKLLGGDELATKTLSRLLGVKIATLIGEDYAEISGTAYLKFESAAQGATKIVFNGKDETIQNGDDDYKVTVSGTEQHFIIEATGSHIFHTILSSDARTDADDEAEVAIYSFKPFTPGLMQDETAHERPAFTKTRSFETKNCIHVDPRDKIGDEHVHCLKASAKATLYVDRKAAKKNGRIRFDRHLSKLSVTYSGSFAMPALPEVPDITAEKTGD
jgi:hypothetical protein